MDGIEATRIIREEIGTEYAKNIPIIAFTANALAGNEDMFLSKGFHAFITKPVDVQRLDSIIKQWVRDEELEKNMPEQQIIDNRTGSERRSFKGDRRIGFDRRMLAEKIDGLDVNKGLERFSGDWETYLDILRSFTSNTKFLLESLKNVNKDNLKDYAINVHGIKSSCRGIGSEKTGSQAEALEKAAKAGDIDFVEANNPVLIEAVFKLIADVDVFFKEEESLRKERPKKDKPYREALSKLLTACDNYSIEDIAETMQEIEAFEYHADDGLALWLRENVDQMNYSEIVEKLSALEK
jgi:CheY-like chemotaxis protein